MRAKKTKKTERQTRDLTTRTYQLRTDTLDEKTRSIEAVIATEAPVMVLDWTRFQIVDEVLLMTGCRIPPAGQVAMLDTHNLSTVQKQLGSTRELRIEGDKLNGRNFFSNSKEAEHAWVLTKEKHLTDNSIGYRVINSVLIEAGKTVEVEGREFTASPDRPLRVTTEWEVKENSVCPVGADVDAKNRNEPQIIIGKDRTMDKFKKWLKERGLKLDELGDEQRDALRTDFDAEQTRADDAVAAVAAERERVNAIRALGGDDVPDEVIERSITDGKTVEETRAEITAVQKRTKMTGNIDPGKVAADAVTAERERVNAIRSLGGDDVPAEVIERSITEGRTLNEARTEVLSAIRQNRPSVGSPAIHIQSGEMTRMLLEDAMLTRAGQEAIILEDKKTGEQRAEEARKHHDISMFDVCRHALMLDGGNVPTGRDETIRAAFSTASLPIILGNIANKSLLKGYTSVPATWQKWCSIGSVSDFKEVTGARLTDTGALEKVPNSGEVKYGAALEEYEKYSVATYAKNFGVTRQNIINDDLRVITRIPQAMGAKAGRKAGDLVYAHLLANGAMTDTVALFHATHKNLNITATLAKATLATCVTAFAKQTDKEGQPINVEPKILLVPPDLRVTALELVKPGVIVITGSTDAVRPAYNALGDLNIEVVSEPRLSNILYSGYSTTTWFMIGDPNIVDTIVVAFLNGQQTPTIERFNAGPDVMGIIFRMFIDVGCKSLDHRGMQKNTA